MDFTLTCPDLRASSRGTNSPPWSRDIVGFVNRFAPLGPEKKRLHGDVKSNIMEH